MTAINWQGPWDAATQYTTGDAVGYAATSSSYVTRGQPTLGTPPPQDPAWDLLAGPSLTWMGPYNPQMTYQPTSAVEYTGSSFIASTQVPPNTPPAAGTVWNLLAAAGASGSGIRWRGDWTQQTQYEINDAVAYQNDNYIAVERPATGVAPSQAPQSWELMTSSPEVQQQAATIAAIIAASGSLGAALVAAIALVPAFKSMVTNPIADAMKAATAASDVAKLASDAATNATNTADAAQQAASAATNAANDARQAATEATNAASAAQQTATEAANTAGAAKAAADGASAAARAATDSATSTATKVTQIDLNTASSFQKIDSDFGQLKKAVDALGEIVQSKKP